MDPINHFGFCYSNNLQQSPIREFSQAARVEQHQFQLNDHSSWDMMPHDDHVYPSEMMNSSADSQFVDTFFDIEHYHDAQFDFDFDFDLDHNSFLMPDDNTDVPVMIQESDYNHDHYQDQDQMRVNGVDEGLQLVHLLLACAEAVGCRDTHLAESILTQIWSSANPFGDSLQRVSYYFATGLKSRLSLLQTNGTIFTGATLPPSVSREEKLEAFHLLHQTTPYIEFGFTAANNAIIQTANRKAEIHNIHNSHSIHSIPNIHIIDLGIAHALQWRSLIRTLASTESTELTELTESTKSTTCKRITPKLIRITGILPDQGDNNELEAEMEALAAEANCFGIELGFRLIAGPATPETLTRENLQLQQGELVFVNSIFHLHTYVKESRGLLKTILQSIKTLGPAMLTVVEQDANHNGPFFLGRFLESLHYYSAIFDSLEARLGRNSIERMKIERNYFAEEIRNIVACEGTERVERHERAEQWRRQLARAGFQVVAGVNRRETVVKGLRSGRRNCEGYTVGDEKGFVLLGWKGRPIMVAAAWQPTSPPPPAS